MLLLTAHEMRLLDRATIESGHASGVALMERAGAGTVDAMERRYGSLLALRVLVLCGSGNNGGDGFVIARQLRACGADVSVGLLGDPGRVRDEALANLARLQQVELPVTPIDSESALAALVAGRDQWDFAVDALLGTGARGEPAGVIAAGVQALRELDERGTRVIAVDLPTGVDADSGAIARRAVRADLTVTFAAPKRGHYLYPGRAFVGALEVVDIGIDPRAIAATATPVSLATPSGMAALLPMRDPRAHKKSAGHVLVIGGSAGLTGALALAARAAMRSGAGYVQVAAPASLHDILETKLTEEMTLRMPENSGRSLALAALEPLLEAAAAADVVALGSGLSRNDESLELARRFVARCTRPLVLDADGLNAFESARTALGERAAGPRVLTPHVGEMARLTGRTAAEIEANRIDLAREWAERWQSVVVLKGAPTVTAGPDGSATVNPSGNPGMATAGAGDVLTGVIASLMAQGIAPEGAACLGAFAHGMAGDIVAGTKGPMGLVAGDIAEALPEALLGLVRVRASG